MMSRQSQRLKRLWGSENIFILFCTNQKQRSIVESNMDTGQIQLGVKKGSGEFLDRYPTQGFFYGGGRGGQMVRYLLCSRIGRRNIDKIIPLLVDESLFAENKLSIAVPTARQHLIFYDIPSRKRVARCTNILHTGATLSGVGEGQRLRKGFQSGGVCETLQANSDGGRNPLKQVELLPTFESLSSAAKIRHSARNTRL